MECDYQAKDSIHEHVFYSAGMLVRNSKPEDGSEKLLLGTCCTTLLCDNYGCADNSGDKLFVEEEGAPVGICQRFISEDKSNPNLEHVAITTESVTS